MPHQPNAALDAIDEQRFASFRQLHDGGSSLALLQALQYCVSHERSPAPWVLPAAIERLAAFERGQPHKKVGRAAGGLARDKQDIIHFYRWDFVEDLKRARANWRHELEIVELYPDDPRIQSRRERLERGVRRFGNTLEDLFYCAESLLQGTPLAGSAETIKSSFRRVERDMKHPVRANRYFVYDYQVLKAAGLEALWNAPLSVKKFVEFLHSES